MAILRGKKVVRRFAARDRRRHTTYRARLPSKGLPRGLYSVRLTVTEVSGSVSETLFTRRL